MKAQSLLLVTLLGVFGVAQAEHDSSYHDGFKRPAVQQQLSKRPYVAPAEKSDVLEGNVVEETKSVENEKHIKLLNLHQLGRRPHVEKSTD